MADEAAYGRAENWRRHRIRWPQATVAFLRDRFPDDVLEVAEYRGEMTIVVRPEVIADVCQALRDDPALAYNYLADITAVDWLEREPRYDVVYHLLSLATYAVVRLKVRVGDEETPNPEVPSVTTVWPRRRLVRARDLRPVRHSLQRASQPDAHPDAARLGGPPAAQGLSADGHSPARPALGRPGAVRRVAASRAWGSRRCARPTAQARPSLTTWRQIRAARIAPDDAPTRTKNAR